MSEEVRYDFDIGNYGMHLGDIDLEKNYYGIFESENIFTEPIKIEG